MMSKNLALVHLMGYSTLAIVLSTATWAPPWAPVVAVPVVLAGLVEAGERYLGDETPSAAPDQTPSAGGDQAAATAGGEA